MREYIYISIYFFLIEIFLWKVILNLSHNVRLLMPVFIEVLLLSSKLDSSI